MSTRAHIVPAAEAPPTAWHDSVRGDVVFRLTVTAEQGPNQGLVQGLAHFAAGGIIRAHHHDRPETAFVVSGSGEARLDDEVRQMKAGDTVFVPAGCVHEWRAPHEAMTFFFTFPADSFDEIAYHFEAEE